jgi:hypothetical protein
MLTNAKIFCLNAASRQAPITGSELQVTITMAIGGMYHFVTAGEKNAAAAQILIVATRRRA